MDKLFVGPKIEEFLPGMETQPISKVELLDDSGVLVGKAGNNTGRTLTATNPDGTNEMAQKILEKVRGFIYKPYNGTNAIIDPAAEIGDGITVDGLYSVLVQTDITFDELYTANISAPTTDEVEDEYPYKTPEEKLRRKIAQTRSLITKTAEEIRLEVQNEVENLSSSVSVQLDSITATVQGQNGKISQMQQTVDSIGLKVQGVENQYTELAVTLDGVTVTDDSGTTKIKGDSIETDTLRVKAANIDGKLSAEKIWLGGKISVYETLDEDSDRAGFIGYIEGEDIDGNTTYGVGMQTASFRQIVVTDEGCRMSTLNCEITLTSKNINLITQYNLWLTGENIYSSTSISNVSDRRKKNQIQHDVERYLPIFDALVPVSFFHTEHSCNKRHLGFIAQDVEKAMLATGIYHDEFAALSIREDGYYGLCYEEFIPLLVAKVQQLDAKIKELTA